MGAALIGSILVIVLAAVVIFLYNKLVRMRNIVRSAWADIEVFLKKRYNLVDNLVETVKGYASHEKSTLQNVTEARTKAMQVTGPVEQGRAENMLTSMLKSVFALSEAYPDLKADGNFLKLQEQIQELEDGIASARRYFNASVRDYNTLTESFPSNIIASVFSFAGEEFFELEDEGAREPVKVDFS